MKWRILVVEDERIVQLDIKMRLERMGYVVVGLASGGEEAVAKAAELTPDLVLMDVRLEGKMDGMEAARLIRETRDTKVLYLTAHASALPDKTREDMRPCLTKPFLTTELENAVAGILCSGNCQAPGNG